MLVYTPLPLERYELCHPVESSDFETITVQVNGTSRAKSWQPIAMELIHQDGRKKLRESDSPWLASAALIFRERAINALRLFLDEFGELLPLSCPEAKLWVFNPTHVIDALDIDASSVCRFSDGTMMRVKRYSFKPQLIRNVHIFKIPNLRASPTFVSKSFTEAWMSGGLRGLEFENVWPA